MQECCRWVIHYDVPWSPSKLQQRNGRVSRHGQVRDVSVFYFRCDQEEDLTFLLKVAKKVEQVKQDLGSVERVFSAAIQRHFKGEKVQFDRLNEFVDQQIAISPERIELGQSSAADVADLSSRAKELLESTDTRLGISSEALIDILQSAITVEGQGSLEEIKGNAGFYRLKPPPRWEGLARQTLTVGSRTDRMELVFDSALAEEEISGHRVLRLKKHQALMRLGHPIMRQAMATLCRQLHDPGGHNAVFRWSVAALHKPGFEALLVFHYTITAINELREPLHDEVVASVFRVEGKRLTPVKDDFGQVVLGSEFHPIKSSARRDDLVRSLRTHWLQHKEALEKFLRSQESGYADRVGASGRCHSETGIGMRPRKATSIVFGNCRTATGNKHSEKSPRNWCGNGSRPSSWPCSRNFSKRQKWGFRNLKSKWPCCGRTWNGLATCLPENATIGSMSPCPNGFKYAKSGSCP